MVPSLVWLCDLCLQHHFALNKDTPLGHGRWKGKQVKKRQIRKTDRKQMEKKEKKDKGGNRATRDKQSVVSFQEHGLMRRNIWETDLLKMLTVWMKTGITPKLHRPWKSFPYWWYFGGTLGNSSFLPRYLRSQRTSCSHQLLARLLIPPGRSSLPSCPHLPSL